MQGIFSFAFSDSCDTSHSLKCEMHPNSVTCMNYTNLLCVQNYLECTLWRVTAAAAFLLCSLLETLQWSHSMNCPRNPYQNPLIEHGATALHVAYLPGFLLILCFSSWFQTKLLLRIAPCDWKRVKMFTWKCFGKWLFTDLFLHWLFCMNETFHCLFFTRKSCRQARSNNITKYQLLSSCLYPVPKKMWMQTRPPTQLVTCQCFFTTHLVLLFLLTQIIYGKRLSV